MCGGWGVSVCVCGGWEVCGCVGGCVEGVILTILFSPPAEFVSRSTAGGPICGTREEWVARD